MRNISDKSVEKIKSHVSCLLTFFLVENLVIYEIIWKNMAEPDRPQMTIKYG